MSADPQSASDTTETWREVLTGSKPTLHKLRRLWLRVPSPPRCKLCAAPFEAPGSLLTKVWKHGPSDSNPLLCNACFGSLRKRPGGAEIEISVLFADIRGSTGIAETRSAAEFRRLVQLFYHRAARAIDDRGGIIDKFLGDGIMVLFIPVITGELHALRAIEAGEALLAAVEHPELVAGGVRVGGGIHTGTAFVGAIGTGDKLDFSALGDTVNVAARLGSVAGPGELVVSASAWAASGRTDTPERRAMTLQGRVASLEVVVLHAGGSRVAA